MELNFYLIYYKSESLGDYIALHYDTSDFPATFLWIDAGGCEFNYIYPGQDIIIDASYKNLPIVEGVDMI